MTAPLLPAKHTVREYNLPVSYSTPRPEDKGYRSIGANGNGRELPEVLHDQMITNSFKAFRVNPIGKRLIEMQVNFVLGNGMSVNAKDPGLMLAIQLWWNDAYNNWPGRILRRLRDLYIYGEWLHRPLVDADGFVRIADLQPDVISTAQPDPYDHGVADKVVLKITEQDGVTTKEVPVPVIRKRLRLAPSGAFALDKEYTGDLFYFGINQTTDSLRGVGELFTVLDYIDVYDDMLFSRAEKVKLNSQMFWDVTVDGMTETQLDAWLEKQTELPPKSGSVFAHNPAIQLAAVVPDLKADDHSKDAALVKSHIVSSQGWPGTWYDDPGSAGRAVGAEMAEPALRNIVNLQGQVRQIISFELDYHLASMRAKGTLKVPEDATYSISFNKPSARDIQRVGPALGRLMDYVGKAVATRLLTQEEARMIVVSQANQLGISDSPLEMELPTELRQLAQKDERVQTIVPGRPGQNGKAPAKESRQPVGVLWGAGTH